MKNKFILLCIVMTLIFGGFGCNQVGDFIKQQTDTMTPEKALKIAEQGEVFNGKAKIGIAGYIADNPKALTEDQKATLVAASAAFELAYTNGKAAIIKIYKAKNGQKVTLADIKDDCIILAGEYLKFKKVIQPLLGNTITYPDEMKIDNVGNEAQIKIEEVIPVVKPEPTSTAEPTSGSSATVPATPPAGAPST